VTGVAWENTRAVATRVGRATSTIRAAAESGLLHGHQGMRDGRPVRGSRWSFAPTAVDAWVQGLDTRAQTEACGCARHLRAVRRTA
jgi:hypothetical protein